jgi:hypothetical protein
MTALWCFGDVDTCENVPVAYERDALRCIVINCFEVLFLSTEFFTMYENRYVRAVHRFVYNVCV